MSDPAAMGGNRRRERDPVKIRKREIEHQLRKSRQITEPLVLRLDKWEAMAKGIESGDTPAKDAGRTIELLRANIEHIRHTVDFELEKQRALQEELAGFDLAP